MCHPEMLLHIPDIEDPVERFVSVVKFYLSGWHIRPSLVGPAQKMGKQKQQHVFDGTQHR